MFLAGLGVFTLSSLASALAGGAATLFAARAGQGLGAAMLSPAALAIIMAAFTGGGERAKALGAWGAVGGAGAAVGVLLGGALTELVDWRLIFLINVPVGLALAAGALRMVPADTGRPRWRGLDLRGALLATLSLGALVFAASQADSAGWGSAQTLGLGAAALTGLAAFAALELRTAEPLLRVQRLADRGIGGGSLMMLIVSAVMFGTFLLSSIYLQSVLGTGPLESGLAFLPMAVAMGLGVHLGTHVISHAGVRAPLAGALAVVAGGTLLLTGVDAGGSYAADLLPGLLVAGVGLGVAVVAVAVSVLTGAGPRRDGDALRAQHDGPRGRRVAGRRRAHHDRGRVGGGRRSSRAASGTRSSPRARWPPSRACSRLRSCPRPRASCRSSASPRRLRPLMPPARQPQRADAQRSIARILDAAIDALASDPEASMAAIARRAGVVRATIYVHFPTREALIAAITERGLAEVSAAIESAEPARGEPADALARVIAAAWGALGRFHALVEINTRLAHADLHALHAPVLGILVPLIERGQRDGSLPGRRAGGLAPGDAARADPRRQRRALRGPDPPEQVEPALLASVLGALAFRSAVSQPHTRVAHEPAHRRVPYARREAAEPQRASGSAAGRRARRRSNRHPQLPALTASTLRKTSPSATLAVRRRRYAKRRRVRPGGRARSAPSPLVSDVSGIVSALAGSGAVEYEWPLARVAVEDRPVSPRSRGGRRPRAR